MFNFGNLTGLKPASLNVTETKQEIKTYAATTNSDVSIHDEVKKEEKKTPDFSEQEVNDILDMLDEMSEEEVQAVLEQLDEYQDGYEEEDDNVSSDKVDKAMEKINEGFAKLEEKAEEGRKLGYPEMMIHINTIGSQFNRQEVYVEALKDLSAEELEAFIKEYGVEEFAKEILETFAWQAKNGDNQEYKDALDELRNKINDEIDPELKAQLLENAGNYAKTEEWSDAFENEKGIDGHVYFL